MSDATPHESVPLKEDSHRQCLVCSKERLRGPRTCHFDGKNDDSRWDFWYPIFKETYLDGVP